MDHPRQTLSFLRNLFEERGIRIKDKLGQNFLIDLNLLELLLRSANLTKDDMVLEVGTGTGSLTARIAEQAGAVVSVEIDPAFHEIAKENVMEHPNVLLMHGDILKSKNELNPQVLEALDEMRRRFRPRHKEIAPLKLVANLPYAVATPLITNFLISDRPFERMVVTVQWEIAARMIAEPGTKEYGGLAVLMQSVAKVELLRRMMPNVFWPRPLVDSAIICIRPNTALRSEVGDVQKFRYFLRDLYSHRRKNLRGALASWPSGRRSKEDVDKKLAELGIDGTVRAETLDRAQHRRLCEAFS